MHRMILFAIGLVAPLAISAAAAPAYASFGAFAYDISNGKYGVSWNEATPSAADAAALKGCSTPDCKIVFRTGPRQCGAIANTADGKVWGGARRDSRDSARLAAMEDCQKRSSAQCQIRTSECNR